MTGFDAPPVEGGSEGGVGFESAYSLEPDHAFSFQGLWPLVAQMADDYGFPGEIIAGMIEQESTWHNYRVHRDGTGHGLLGLDDNGLLQDFCDWLGLPRGAFGAGADADIIPVEWQIEFAAWQLRRYVDVYPDVEADPVKAAQAWHASGAGRDTPRGKSYGDLIRGHMARLFPHP